MGSNETKTMKMENGSVAVMGYNSQINYKHGIQQELNKGKRFSITLRHNATKVPTNPTPPSDIIEENIPKAIGKTIKIYDEDGNSFPAILKSMEKKGDNTYLIKFTNAKKKEYGMMIKGNGYSVKKDSFLEVVDLPDILYPKKDTPITPPTPPAETAKFKVGEKVFVGKKTKEGIVYTEYIVRGYDKTGEKVLLKNLDGTNKTGGGLKPSSIIRELPNNAEAKVEAKANNRKFEELNAYYVPELKKGYDYYRVKVSDDGTTITYNTVIGKDITSKFKGTVLDIPGVEWIMIYDFGKKPKVIEKSSGVSLPSSPTKSQKELLEDVLNRVSSKTKEDIIEAIKHQTSVYPKVESEPKVTSEYGNPEDYTDANGQEGLAFSIRETFKLPKVNFC